MTDSYTQSTWSEKDRLFESPLRPQCFGDFVGQIAIQERLKILIEAAKLRNETIGHLLFYGPPGLGKTTLAHIIAKEMGSNLVTTTGPIVEKPGDLAGILTNLQPKDVLFIDEIHRLPKTIEEYLYSAMEDYQLDLMIDSGPSARSVQITLNPFTLIGATTRFGLLTSPMRSRFLFTARLDFYDLLSLETIIYRSAHLLHVPIDKKGASLIAARCRGTPRIANNLLRWVRDFAQTKNEKTISYDTAKKALDMLAIDDIGLDEMDKKILATIIDHFNGGPVGIQTLAVSLSEDSSTLVEVYEPYLIEKGFLKRTLRGREVTKLAYEHLGRKVPAKHGEKK